MTMPLDGVRILDFTRHMAGPYATLFLADFGADVIKIESLPHGDGSRHIGTAFHNGESAIFLMWNRGKRSVALDLRKPGALAVVDRLAQNCDVLIENYRPGVADAIGIGYPRLATLNPRLIYVSISAFGDGPLAPRPGTDPVVQAMSGVMSVTGEPEGGPLLVGIPIADFTGSMLASQAVMLGLLARDRTGRGQRIDVSMLYGLLWSLTTRLASYWNDGQDPKRHGSAHSVVVPYQAFKTADGYAVAGVWEDGGWPRFCQAIERPDLADAPRFATNIDRVANRADLTAILDGVFATRTTADWEERFHHARALFGPVYSFSQILNHPQVVGAGLISSVDHPIAGRTPQLGPVIFLSDTPGRIGTPAPLLGQHTSEVLRETGFAEAEIAELCRNGVALETPIPLATTSQ